MSEALRSVLALFSINVDDKQLASADKKIEGFTKKLASAGKAFAEVFAVKEVAEFFDAQIEGAARMEDLAEKLGLTTDELQHFQFAAKSVGVDAESSAHSLGFLNKNMGEALTGSKESAEAFGKLGVKLKDSGGKVRPVGDVLLDVADGLQGLGSQQVRAAYAMKLFGRQGQTLLPILGQGSKKIKEMYGEADDLGIILGGDLYKDAKKTREEIERFGMIVDAFKARLAHAAEGGIRVVAHWLQKIGPYLKGVSDRTDLLKHSLQFLGIAGLIALAPLVATVWTLLSPFLLTTAAVIALGLAFDDLATFIEGGDSVFGDFLDKFGLLGGQKNALKELKAMWNDLVQVLESIDWKGLGEAFRSGFGAVIKETAVELAKMAKLVIKLGEGIGWLLDKLGLIDTTVAEAMTPEEYDAKYGKGNIVGPDGKPTGERSATGPSDAPQASSATAPAGGGLDLLGAGGDPRQTAPVTAPAGGSTFSNTENTPTVVNHFAVTVGGDVKNPKQVGQDIASSAATELQKTNYSALLATKRP